MIAQSFQYPNLTFFIYILISKIKSAGKGDITVNDSDFSVVTVVHKDIDGNALKITDFILQIPVIPCRSMRADINAAEVIVHHFTSTQQQAAFSLRISRTLDQSLPCAMMKINEYKFFSLL